MSRKIIGVTVGTPLPKPNFKQTDPAKGDYIKNKPVGIEGQIVGFNENGNMVAMDSLQPDWNQTDENAADFIKNKPDGADALAALAEVGFIEPVASDDGIFYIDNNDNILTLN